MQPTDLTIRARGALLNTPSVAEYDVFPEGSAQSLGEELFRTLPQIFESQVRRTPDADAVVYGTTTMTYRELNERSNRLARLLITRGAGPERLVALALPRSEEMLVAILATSKAGAAYVPVDPDYPPARLAGVLSSAVPLLTLTSGAVRHRLPDDVDTIELDASGTHALLGDQAAHNVSDAERVASLTADHAAYVIYTSGSTGKPKGVVVTHWGLAGLAADHLDRFGISPGDGVLQFASFSFDCSVGDIVMALASGAALIIRPQDCLSGHELGELIDRTSATHVTIPPQVLAALPAAEYPTLKSLATAGDVCSAQQVTQWSQGRRMFNVYGPTEFTVDSVVAEVTADTEGDIATGPPIGLPILNTSAYVLDESLRAVPCGTEGELFLAGSGLARGYLGEPGLTAERFLPFPFGRPGERMYRTGDLVRRRPDGNLEFLGRRDHQVKIRGFRIEPGEIETVLNRHAAVTSSVVVAWEEAHGHKRLVAYVTASRTTPDPGDLLAYAARELPAHMVPSAVVPLDAFPLTPNGKLNREELPAPGVTGHVSLAAPRTPREELLCGLFAESLGLEQVGAHDRFFDLGGDSILAIRLASLVRSAGWILAPKDVFAHQHVAALAELLEPVRAGEGVVEEHGADSDGLGPNLMSISQDEIDDLVSEWGNEFS